MFATGATQIPPLGFHDPSKITVLQLDSMSGNFANLNTSPQELELPYHESYDDFKKSIDCALSNQSSGFSTHRKTHPQTCSECFYLII